MALRPLAVIIFLVFSNTCYSKPGDAEILGQSPLLQEKKVDEKKESKDLQNLIISKPNHKNSEISTELKNEKVAIYSYRQAFTFGLGVTLDSESKSDGLLHFQYLPPSEDNWRWEFGASVFQSGVGSLSAGLRRIWNSFSLFRPYIEPGFAIKTDSSAQLAEVFELGNFHGEFFAGFEYLFLPPFSIRFDGGVSASTDQQEALIRLALSWAWY